MITEEKTYNAGIIDGEGSIMLLKFHNNQFPAPCISVSSTIFALNMDAKHAVLKGSSIGYCSLIRLFAAQFKDSHLDMSTILPHEALNKIIVFSRLRGDFNFKYFSLMHKYFLCKS